MSWLQGFNRSITESSVKKIIETSEAKWKRRTGAGDTALAWSTCPSWARSPYGSAGPTEVECSVECWMLGLQQSRRLHHAQRVVNERVGAPTHYQQHSLASRLGNYCFSDRIAEIPIASTDLIWSIMRSYDGNREKWICLLVIIGHLSPSWRMDLLPTV